MSKIINDVVKNIFGTNLINENFEFISEFTFLWSMLESKIKKNDDSVNLKRIESIINSLEFKKNRESSRKFQSIPEFVHIEKTNDDIILSFPNIPFKVSLFPTERKSDIEWFKKHFEQLEIVEKENSKIILLMCFICYRLRNNLFHGNKKFDELHQQKELFNLINNFLSEFRIEINNIVIN